MRALAVASILCVSLLVTSGAQTARVQVVPDEAGRRVDVIIDGKPFTSYIYPTTLKKPSLFPLRTAKGTLVTRGYPLETRPNERVDHPHHVGLWLNHGNVNGLDFWNNSDETSGRRRRRRWARSSTAASSKRRAAPIEGSWPSRPTG